MSLDSGGPLGDSGTMQPLAPFVHLIRVDAGKNMARYYGISLQATLFGEVTVLRQWGRIGTRGSGLMQTFDAGAAAVLAQDRLAQSKQRRGYHRLL